MANKRQQTQTFWAEWAQQRRADADKIAKSYRTQADAMDKLLLERGCKCDPLIQLAVTPSGPTTKDAMFTHAFTCEEG